MRIGGNLLGQDRAACYLLPSARGGPHRAHHLLQEASVAEATKRCMCVEVNANEKVKDAEVWPADVAKLGIDARTS